MLGREDMVERSQLIEIGESCLGVASVQVLGELEHIVGVAALRPVDIVDEIGASLFAGEMLSTAVATEGEGPLSCYNIPEESTGIVEGLVAAQF